MNLEYKHPYHDLASVAEAIEMKSSIKHQETLLEKMKQQYGQAVTLSEHLNNQARNDLEAKSSRSESKNESSNMTLAEFSKSYMEIHGVKLYDPIGLSEKIDVLEKEITDFESEVDFVLSEKNAVTMIEVSD